MPRKGYSNQGGRRTGTQGKAYGNRTDLNENRQPIRVATGQPYGARAEQVAAQQAVPLPAAPPVRVSPPGPALGSFGAFDRPTERPDEPWTAGLKVGPGAGPEVVSTPFTLSADEDVVARLRGLYQAFPNDDIERLLTYAEQRAGEGI